MLRRLFLTFSVFGLFWSCSKLNPKITAPAYLQIDSFTVITDYGTQGTSNQKFSDVLIESHTSNYGYYSIPGKIPLPFTGATYLIIRPTIKVNGVSSLRLDYPLMKGCDTTLPLAGGQITKFRPVFKYYPTVNFRFPEDFEAAGINMKNSNAADTFGYQIVNNSNHPGSQMPGSQNCMLMKLDINHTICQAQSNQPFHLPTDGSNIYLEINYKCNTDFEVGLIGTNNIGAQGTDQRTIGGANASAAWNKIYFSLSEITRTPPTYAYYYLYFSKSTYDSNTTTNEIYIDNIKVISQN